ncbi:MAG: hypothetical protein Tsb006_3570 [Rickettsiaceae bacterium]
MKTQEMPGYEQFVNYALRTFQPSLLKAILKGDVEAAKKVIESYQEAIGFFEEGAEDYDHVILNIALEPINGGKTPIQLAYELNNQNIVSLLIDQGADIHDVPEIALSGEYQ